MLPIIVELLYRRAFVETPRSLTFSLPPSLYALLLFFSLFLPCLGLRQEKGMKRTVKERQRESSSWLQLTEGWGGTGLRQLADI